MSSLPLDTIICGDCEAVMSTWPADSVHCIVTSPPYWGLRDYGVDAAHMRETACAAYGYADAMVAEKRARETG